MKYLIIALILVLVFYGPITRALRGTPRSHKPAPPSQRPPKAEEMVQCAHCGVHLPDGEAVRDGQGRPYCSAAHRLAGPAQG